MRGEDASKRSRPSHAGPELYILSPLTENFDAFRLENRPSWSWTTADCWPPPPPSVLTGGSEDQHVGLTRLETETLSGNSEMARRGGGKGEN